MKHVICKNLEETVANFGSCTDPNGLLEIGKTYTVIEEDVHSWHTKLYLAEFPDKPFNSCHFERCLTKRK